MKIKKHTFTKLQYLRDDRGITLNSAGGELAYNVTQNAIKIIKNSRVYSLLVKSIPAKYVDLYYEKMIYLAFLPIACELVVYYHDKRKCGKAHVNVVNVDDFPCPTLLSEIWPDNSVGFSLSYSGQIKTKAKEMVKQLLKCQNSFKSLYHLLDNKKDKIEQLELCNANIAVNYAEGFDISKRSDIYWLQGSGVDPKSVIIYYDSKYRMTCCDNEQTSQDFFNGIGVKQVKLWEWYVPTKKDVYSEIITSLKLIKKFDDIERWIKKTAIFLCNRSSYWSCFFDDYGIKIQLDPTEYGLETIFKQIAIHNIGGLSIGKTRSYPVLIDGEFLGYYPNDIFFTWGKDSGKRTQITNPHIENILISGFPYISKRPIHDKETALLNSVLNTGKTKFNILLLDNTFDDPHTKSKITSYYHAVLDWLSEDEDVGLVVKPKKTLYLQTIPSIFDKINELENKTDRVVLVKDSFQKIPSSYLNGVDMVIGTSGVMSSALLECVVSGIRGVFYDYYGLHYHEIDLYKWGENEVIFTDLNKMITALKVYKNDSSSRPKLGDWSDKLHDLDPFCDKSGGKRIGTYIRWLQEGYKAGKGRSDVIECANKEYADSWGTDKIYQKGE